MHHSDKYSIAWFKLAECVVRGEKERALGVYRLLAHSLDDDALAEQLAGDLLLSFQDVTSAVERYKLSAQQYLKQNKTLQAAAVYEHLVTIEPRVEGNRLHLIELYLRLGSSAKVNEHVQALFTQLIEEKKLDKAAYIAEQLESSVEVSTIAIMQEQLLFAFLAHNHSHELALPRLHKIIACWNQTAATEELQQLLNKIKTLDDGLYRSAVNHYEKSQ